MSDKKYNSKDLRETWGTRPDGDNYEKISLNFTDGEEHHICDICDETKRCAHLRMMCGDSAVICKDCLQLIIEAFDE